MELAAAINEPYRRFTYLLFAIDPDRQYKSFDIAKGNGKSRIIDAPVTALKNIQKKICAILSKIYVPPYPANAFIFGRSIVTNAIPHVKAKSVLKLDLQDYFPSIHFGRVRGLFMAPPFSFNQDVATTLARACCKGGCLPQGAPTSPILSNMISLKMDAQLNRIAKSNRCNYSRYADDITFSSTKDIFPLVVTNAKGLYEPAQEITDCILRNGFAVNTYKTKFMVGRDSKFVAGIKVNSKINTSRKHVRAVRAMLHALEKFGPEASVAEHLRRWRRRHTISSPTNFLQILKGKISFIRMVKGGGDLSVVRLENRLDEWMSLYSGAQVDVRRVETLIAQDDTYHAVVYTEGKTDALHLRYALKRLQKLSLYNNMKLIFYDFPPDTTSGETELKKILGTAKVANNTGKLKIVIFDRDVTGDVGDSRRPKYWGSNVWSFKLPCPGPRTLYENVISIEHYYPDKILFKQDNEGRRLFFVDEFDANTLAHKSIAGVICRKDVIGKKRPGVVICEGVRDQQGKSLTLSKSDFSKNIARGQFFVSDTEMLEFKPVFSAIERLIKKNHYC
nr:reverse transcriptase domain-containing protein [Fundidesulfovibrio agrisoli]